jgi:putative spermidine/putrescine transport system substrate-binding protein
MSQHDDNAYLLKCFDGDPTRRQILRGLMAAGAGAATLTPFAGHLASAASEDAAQLTIFAWPGLVPDILKEKSIPPFNQAYPKVNIKLDVSTNVTMYPKMLAARNNPVISGGMFSTLFTQRGTSDGLWVKFDEANLPNWKHVPPELMHPGGFGISFGFTPFGIMYNPDRTEKPKSWADLFDPKYKGRIMMWDSYFDAYIAAAVVSGKGPNVEEGIKVWEKHKQNIGGWTTSPTVSEDHVSRGEMWIAPHWGAWSEQARSTGKNVAFTVPKEGGVVYGNYMVSVTGFPPKVTELTQRYLNTWIAEDCQVAWVQKGFFAPSNRNVKIPAELTKLEAVMTPEVAATRLITYDVKSVGESIPKLKAIIDRTLKG